MKGKWPSFENVFKSGRYLNLLHLHLEPVEALEQVREACIQSENLTAELKFLLADPNWRPHLVAAVGFIWSGRKELIPDLWGALDRDSWVSPQLAVAASLRDEKFGENAWLRIENWLLEGSSCNEKGRSFGTLTSFSSAQNRPLSAKTILSLCFLLSERIEYQTRVASFQNKPRVLERLQKEMDRGDEIARDWKKALSEGWNKAGLGSESGTALCW